MYEAYIGTILPWSASFAPLGWYFCQGQQLNIYEAQALFSLINYTYGGSGTNFNLPNLQQRIPIGVGTPPGSTTPIALTKTGGTASATLTLPSHSHTLGGTVSAQLSVSGTATSNVAAPSASVSPGTLTRTLSGASTPFGMYAASTAGTPVDIGQLTLTPPSVNAGATTGSAGVPQPASFDTRPPFLVLNYIICWDGIYPDFNS